MPNISENISRIRQLIQQARNAASKVHAHSLSHTHTHPEVGIGTQKPVIFSFSFLHPGECVDEVQRVVQCSGPYSP